VTNLIKQDKPFNWVVIGPGHIAKKFVAALEAPNCGQLHGLLGNSIEKSKHFLAQLDLSNDTIQIYPSLESLLEDKHIDGIYIATPHSAHYQYAKSALLAGIPVLCEKPLTVTAKQTQELIELSQQNNTFLMEAMWSKCLPIWQRIKTLINEGLIGELDHLRADMGTRFDTNPAGRIFNKALAGGALLDIGIYPTTLFIWLNQHSPIRIVSDAIIGHTGVDEKTWVNLHFNNQIVANFSLTTRSVTENVMQIYGEKGHMKINSRFWHPERIEYCVDGQTQHEEFPLELNGFEYQIREAVNCIQKGLIETPIIPHSETLSVMQTLDTIRQQIGLRYDVDNDFQMCCMYKTFSACY